MARPRTYKTQGIVLKQIPLGEADRILTIHTLDVGKLRAVAKGVRRPKSKMAGHLEPLTHVLVSVAEGKNLDTILEAEIIHSFRELRVDLQRISRAIYLADLVESFTSERSPSTATFHLLLETLGLLQSETRQEQILRYFELQLLKFSGFGPELRRCVECSYVLDAVDHLFSPTYGGVLCHNCRIAQTGGMLRISLGAMKVLRFFQIASYPRIIELRLPDPLLAEIDSLLTAYIQYVLDRELKSTKFMNLVTSPKKPFDFIADQQK